MGRRRRAASLARLAVQWRQFQWDNLDCWLGLARSFALTLVPARALTAIKTARGTAG
jgi:predicted protein tyrosine phosphatase